MRKMYLGLMFILAGILSVQAMAQVNLSGLSEEQMLQLNAQAAKIRADNAAAAKNVTSTVTDSISTIITDPERVSTWGNQAAIAAEGFANALGIAASTVGVSVNEFVATDAGTLVVIGIGLKIFGPMLTTFLIVVLGFIVIFFLTRMLVRTFIGIDRIEKSEPKTYLWGFYTSKNERVIYNKLDDCGEGVYLFVLCAMAGALISLIVIFANVL